ncbi:hypothetical protein C4D60_Mb06t03730 [Musa balbisiana]|uniref:Uncharacterized protein n=1 Tax=Musa balbisiana TaxID=52838 RepID=A0A4S8IKB5_MUSBA|nr:hypothetical protein C4D60_Mb06t03730 [Musa balbisiana]
MVSVHHMEAWIRAAGVNGNFSKWFSVVKCQAVCFSGFVSGPKSVNGNLSKQNDRDGYVRRSLSYGLENLLENEMVAEVNESESGTDTYSFQTRRGWSGR